MNRTKPGEAEFLIAIIKTLDKHGCRYYKKESLATNIPIQTLENKIEMYCQSAIERYDSWSIAEVEESSTPLGEGGSHALPSCRGKATRPARGMTSQVAKGFVWPSEIVLLGLVLSDDYDRSRHGFGAIFEFDDIDISSGRDVNAVLPAIPGLAVAGGGEDGLAVPIEDCHLTVSIPG
jgi:hypothetical protein